MQQGRDVDPQTNWWAVQEFLPGLILQRIEEKMVSAFDMTGVPAIAMKGGSVPKPLDQDLDALVGQSVDLVGMKNHVFDLVQGSASGIFVIGPLGFALARRGRILPIQDAGVKAKNI